MSEIEQITDRRKCPNYEFCRMVGRPLITVAQQVAGMRQAAAPESPAALAAEPQSILPFVTTLNAALAGQFADNMSAGIVSGMAPADRCASCYFTTALNILAGPDDMPPPVAAQPQ
jgi:hypothetical protein